MKLQLVRYFLFIALTLLGVSCSEESTTKSNQEKPVTTNSSVVVKKDSVRSLTKDTITSHIEPDTVVSKSIQEEIIQPATPPEPIEPKKKSQKPVQPKVKKTIATPIEKTPEQKEVKDSVQPKINEEVIQVKKTDSVSMMLNDSVINMDTINISVEQNNVGLSKEELAKMQPEQIDYKKLQNQLTELNENELDFDTLAPWEKDSIGLLLDEKRFTYEFQVGSEFYRQKEYRKAIEHLERAVLSSKNNAQAILLMGKSYMEIEQLDNAVNIFEQLTQNQNALAIYLAEAAYFKAKCLIDLNKVKKARKELKNVIKLNQVFVTEAEDLLQEIAE